jgi:hypothetical protein
MDYPWYEILEFSDNILQGDLIVNCPIIIPPNSFEQQELQAKEANVIVMSQSCDIVNNKVEIILVCPYVTLEDFLSRHPMSQDGNKKGREKVLENLKQGHFNQYHILQKEKKYSLNDNIIVDFRNVYGVHFEFLKNHASKIESRIRLLPPYREHLSQAFARYFMRVGLPINIDI